jgi:hypothetical protein
MNENQTNRSPRQKALKWAGKASLLAANQYLERRNNQQLSEPTQEQSETNQEQPQPTIKVEQPETNQEEYQQAKHPQGNKARRWAKRASLFAASEYLRSNNQQPPEANKKLTPLETFLDILQVGVYTIGAIALTILLLVLRFGYGVH